MLISHKTKFILFNFSKSYFPGTDFINLRFTL